ncbi:MAG: hypothetical protein V1738_06680 [Patescibacteria group bacterium]
MRVISLFVMAIVLSIGCSVTAESQHPVTAPTKSNVAPSAPVANPTIKISEGCLSVTAPANWSVKRVPGANVERPNYSMVSLINDRGQSIILFHPHGNSDIILQVFQNDFIKASVAAKILAQWPAKLREYGYRSVTVSDPSPSSNNGIQYVTTSVFLDGSTEIEYRLYMPDPRDFFSKILISTTVPAQPGESFPAEVLRIVRTLVYSPPAVTH